MILDCASSKGPLFPAPHSLVQPGEIINICKIITAMSNPQIQGIDGAEMQHNSNDLTHWGWRTHIRESMLARRLMRQPEQPGWHWIISNNFISKLGEEKQAFGDGVKELSPTTHRQYYWYKKQNQTCSVTRWMLTSHTMQKTIKCCCARDAIKASSIDYYKPTVITS